MIKHLELKKQSDRIFELIEKSENTFESDDEMRSHFAKYICVLCSGFLENSIKIVYSEYVRKQTTNSYIITYITNSLQRIQNPKAPKFKEIAKSFRPDWEPLLNTFLEKGERSSAITSIMDNRHLVAHGKDSEITLSRIKAYHQKAVEVIEYIEQQCELFD